MNPFPKTPSDGSQQQQQLLELIKQNPQLLKKYEEEMAKSKLSSQPMSNKEYQQKLKNGGLDPYLDQEGGLVIQPESGFVLKFLEKRNGEKIFVNIVKHHAIDHPEEKLLVDFENQPGLRIPMSMGKIRQSNDKAGNICKVVDVVLNPKVVENADTNNDILHFTAQIIANYLLEKYKITISDQVLVKLKGVKYKGSMVEVQRVKAKKSPKIQQLSQEQHLEEQQRKDSEEQLFRELNGQTDNKMICPEFQVYSLHEDKTREEYCCDSAKSRIIGLQILISLPLLIHSRAIHLEGNDSYLQLSVKGIYAISLKMPVQIAHYHGKWAKKDRVLKVEAQAKPTEKNHNEEGPKPQKLNISLDNQLLDQLV